MPLLVTTQTCETALCKYTDFKLNAAIYAPRNLGALRAMTTGLKPFGPLDFVLRALWSLRPCNPCSGDWIVC